MQNATALVDAVDWDSHVLGPREGWPASLRTMLNTVLGSPESMYLVWGAEHSFLFNDAYAPILGPRLEGAMGAPFQRLWADAWPTVEPFFRRAEAGESTRLTDLPVPMARRGVPEDTWWTFSYTPVRDETGVVVGVLCITNETTDRVLGEAARAEAIAQQDLLNNELSHRVKNIISMVQAVASQSLRGLGDRAIVTAFEDRLVALGHAHNVLLDHHWRPASVHAAIAPMLNLYNGRDQFHIEGPEVFLAANATLSLSLLLHELATNAVKYGALSLDGGVVEIAWSVVPSSAGDSLVLEWREKGGPPVVAPVRTGFGSRLIAMGLVGTRDTRLTYAASGFEARFSATLDKLSRD